ncbi:MAG TPA: hypothetical protein VF881_11655 [Polyangiaceae bacterium]
MLRLRTTLVACAMSVSGILVFFSCGGSDSAPFAGGPGGACKDGCKAPLFCEATLGCAECADDAACSAGRPRCVLGRCEVCASSADCPASAPACFPRDHTCHLACSTGGCSGETTCDAATGICFGCRTDVDCAGTTTPLCNPTTAECVACLDDSHCGAAAPFCFVREGHCVQCLSSAQCAPAAPICGDDFKCRAGCTSNAGCPTDKPVCNLATADCVACLSATDCPSPTLFCDEGHCAECVDDSSCPIERRFCKDRRCVECENNDTCPLERPECSQNVCIVKL